MMTDEELARRQRIIAHEERALADRFARLDRALYRTRGGRVVRLFRRFDAWFIELPTSLIVLSAFATGLALAAILAWLGH